MHVRNAALVLLALSLLLLPAAPARADDDAEQIAAWIEALAGREPAQEAEAGLRSRATAAVPGLRRALMRSEPRGPALTTRLLAAMQHESALARQGAAWALGKSASQGWAVHEALTKALDAKPLQVRWAAAHALVQRGSKPNAALEPLSMAAAATHYRSPFSIRYVAGAEGFLGGGRKRGVEEIQGRDAAPAYFQFGAEGAAHASRAVKPGLRSISADPVILLTRFGPPAIPHLKRHLESRFLEIGRYAALGLSTLDDPEFACLPTLLGLLAQGRGNPDDEPPVEDPEIRSPPEIDWHATSFEALENLGLRAVPLALEHLGDATPKARTAMQDGIRAWLVGLGAPVRRHLEAARIHAGLGTWIDGVLAALDAEAEKARKAASKDSGKDG